MALLGDAKVRQPESGVTRSGDRMLVTADVTGRVQLTAEENVARDQHDTAVYRDADAMRTRPEEPAAGRPAPPPAELTPATEPTTRPDQPAPGNEAPAPAGSDLVPPTPAAPASPAAPAAPAAPVARPAGRTTSARPPAPPRGRPARKMLPVAFEAGDVETVDADDGTVATVLTGNVILRQRKPNGDFVELTAQQRRPVQPAQEPARRAEVRGPQPRARATSPARTSRATCGSS